MSCIDPATIRNIGIMAHIDAGKTTLSERILFYTQKIHKLGEVHDGAATMDFLPEEQERGITITSACSTCKWDDVIINLIDTPGHVDFTIEVERSLRVLDSAICVFCAVGGVEPQSETVWRQSEKYHIPKLAFINKIDRDGADFSAVLKSIRVRLHANPVALNIPYGEGSQFSGILDLIYEQKIIFSTDDQGRTLIKTDFTDEEANFARPWREKLLEAVAEADDTFMEQWYDGTWSLKDLQAALRRAAISSSLTPCLAGAALRNCGVQPLLDAIKMYLPSPLDVPVMTINPADGKERVIVPSQDSEPVGLVFKILMEGSRKNSFIRLYTGCVKEGANLYNVRSGRMDRAGRLFRLHADRRENLEELGPGDIAVITGLRDAQTGDTYTAKTNPQLLMPIVTYEPVITIALEPLNADEGKVLDEALSRYCLEDPTLKAITDEESGLRELSGMGELHLDVILERLKREYKISPRAGQPRAVMRETAAKAASAHVNFEKEFGKEKHQGEVEIRIIPCERGSGNLITDYLPDDKLEARKLMPEPFVQAVYEGVENALATGVIAGWPITDVHIVIDKIVRIENLTTLPGLKMAAAQAIQEAMQQASPKILEPVMQVDISSPEEYLGNVIGLFTQCGGRIEGMEDKMDLKELHGLAPLRNLFGFSTPLRSATQGRAVFNMTFKNYDTL